MAQRQRVENVHVSYEPSDAQPEDDYDVIMGVSVSCSVCGGHVSIRPIKVGMVKEQTFYSAKIEGSNNFGPEVESQGHCRQCGTVIQLTWRSFKDAVKRAQREGRWYKFFRENPPTERQLAAIQKI